MTKLSLRNQILIPVSLIILVGISTATWINVSNQIDLESRRIGMRAEEIFTTMSKTSLPIHQSVLKQIESISGFHCVATSNETHASSFDDQQQHEFLEWINQQEQTNLPEESELDSERFFLFSRMINRPTENRQVYLLYPQSALQESIQSFVVPQVVTGLVSILLTIGLVIFVARNVTRPIGQLQMHLENISNGEFGITVKDQPGEIGILFQSVNEMANRLQSYEQKIRTQEKLLTLDQMGGGIAHQMRNSITGCRLALELHRDNCSGDSESLSIATRQLETMESFQKRFLTLGKGPAEKTEDLDLTKLISGYLPILEPIAKHVSVEFELDLPGESAVMIHGSADRIEQLLNNLVMNAIDAASFSNQTPRRVCVQLRAIRETEDLKSGAPKSNSVAEICVMDTGDGISPEIEDRLFEPLATTRPDGVGLGLAIVKQTVDELDGTIHWERSNDLTLFRIQIPMLAQLRDG